MLLEVMLWHLKLCQFRPMSTAFVSTGSRVHLGVFSFCCDTESKTHPCLFCPKGWLNCTVHSQLR